MSLTHPSVIAYFPTFTERFEGRVKTMYRDKKNLVTVGLGNLIDPIELGAGLKWNEGLASNEEYRHEWWFVKTLPGLDSLGWVAAASAARPTGRRVLYLDDVTIDALVAAKLASNEEVMLHGFPDFGTMPPDCQLFLHSMAWACGPMFWSKHTPNGYPRLTSLINGKDYVAAVSECDINPKIGTIVARNAANRQLLMNADWSIRSGAGPGSLIYPFNGILIYPFNANKQAPPTPGRVTVKGETFVLKQDAGSVQLALIMCGYNISDDGIMGPKTKEAIMAFQASNHLKVDGVVGPDTGAAIIRKLQTMGK